MFIEPARIAAAIGPLEGWALERRLKPSERPYPAASRTPGELRFSASGDPELEQAYRTHWLSPDLTEEQHARLSKRAARAA